MENVPHVVRRRLLQSLNDILVQRDNGLDLALHVEEEVRDGAGAVLAVSNE